MRRDEKAVPTHPLVNVDRKTEMDLPNCLLIVDQVQHVYECTPLIGGGSGRIVRMEIPDPTGNSYAILGTLPDQIDVIRIRGVTLNGVSRVSKGAAFDARTCDHRKGAALQRLSLAFTERRYAKALCIDKAQLAACDQGGQSSGSKAS